MHVQNCTHIEVSDVAVKLNVCVCIGLLHIASECSLKLKRQKKKRIFGQRSAFLFHRQFAYTKKETAATLHIACVCEYSLI